MIEYRLGIFYWFGYVLPLQERLKMIREAGFDVVSIWWEDEMAFQCEKKEEVPSLVEDVGLILENIHLPYQTCNDLWSREEEVRKKVLKEHEAWLVDAASHRVPTVVMHIADGPHPPGPFSKGLDSITYLLGVAEDLGVVIALENTQFTTYLRDLFVDLDSENLRLCYDSSHDYLEGEKGSILRDLGSFISTTHLSDNDGEKDRHWLPKEGIVDWKETMTLLREKGFRGPLSMEVFPKKREEKPEVFLKRAYQRVYELAEMM